MLSKRHCEAIRADGSQCQGWAVTGSQFCNTHDPNFAEARQEARKRGGQAKTRRKLAMLQSLTGASGQLNEDGLITLEPKPINTAQDLLDRLARELAIMDAFEVSFERSRTINALLNTGAKLLEASDVEKRLKAIEERLQASGALDIPADYFAEGEAL